MAYRTIDDNDTIQIRRAQGGNKPETRTVAELNEYFSKEENTEIDTLQAQVGDYAPDTTRSTITGDLEQLQADVQTTETGLLDRTAALEADVQTAETGLLDRTAALEADVQTAETGLLDRAAALEAIVQTAASGTPVAPVAATASLAIASGISLDLTARTAGAVGNDITVTLVDPKADGDIGVAVTGNNIVVTLGYGTGAITSTLADVKTAIEMTPAAHALVAVAVTGSDATIAIAVDKTNLALGADGTVGVAGAMLYDATGIYVSTDISTTAVSHWKKITFDV